MLFEFSLKPVAISHNFRGKYSSLCCSDYWKMHLQVKQLNLDILLMLSAVPGNILPAIIFTRPQAEGNLPTHFSQVVFLPKPVPLAERATTSKGYIGSSAWFPLIKNFICYFSFVRSLIDTLFIFYFVSISCLFFSGNS